VNADIIKSYLVELGFVVDSPTKNKFDETLRTTLAAVTKFTSGSARMFAEFGAAAVTALTGIATGTVFMMNEVAKSDLQMQLLARRMYMSLPAMREMKMALDAMGMSAEDVLLGPPEVREQYRRLTNDNRRMMADMGAGGFEQEMVKIRKIIYEFQAMEQEAKIFIMSLTKSLSVALTGDENGLLNRLKGWNEWLVANTPKLSQEFSTYLVPVLRDVKEVWKDIADMGKMATSEILRFLGTLYGDSGLKTGEVNIRNIGTALDYVSGSVRKVFDELDKIGHFIDAHPWALTLTMAAAGAVAGAGAGGMATIFAGGVGAIPGAAIGALTMGMAGAAIANAHGVDAANSPTASSKMSKDALAGMAATVAAQYGSIPNFAQVFNNLIGAESAWNPNAKSSAGAMGLTQLMPKTASSLGVTDVLDPMQNLRGGASNLASMYYRYNGDWNKALAAYNWGPGNVDKFGMGNLPKETQDYIPKVLGGITVNVTVATNASPHEIASAVSSEMKKVYQRQQVQANPVYVTP
jgi:hypothetical protein